MALATSDPLGWAYVGIATGWTLALAAGMLFLHRYRHLPSLQIRRLPLLFTAVASLHAYGALTWTVYIWKSILPCHSEFWLMSIYLPFGIAFFQAANSQFLHIATRQKQFAYLNVLSDGQQLERREAGRFTYARLRKIFKGNERADKIDRMMMWIAVGMVVQIALTAFVFFGSRKFHPGYGIFDYKSFGSEEELKRSCIRGWEWWVSIVWQFLWSWVYAPYLLWKSRAIRDVHGWRTQTICCCLAGLPASPLWLAGLYSPHMATVNQYIPPPMWFGISIFFVEGFAIGMPIVQVLRTKTLRQETLDALNTWEKRQDVQRRSNATMAVSKAMSAKDSMLTGTTYMYASEGTQTPAESIRDPNSTDVFNMTTMEFTLRTNPEPLLRFAALKDFSGENVSFLTHIAEWRRAWFVALASTEEQRHKQFIAAVRIFTSFVSLDYAEFPINISSPEMKRLHNVFAGAAAILMRRPSTSSTTDTITPFDMEGTDADSTVDFKTGINLDTLGRANLKSVMQMTVFKRQEEVPDIPVPDDFTAEIFESAEREIKYLVFVNSWPKFVLAHCLPAEQAEGQIKQHEPGWRSRLLCNV
ncbi:hypothetical protein M011DRAFT_398076 [Sporormia fimetaria CBS 119925]|uniref:RGS domain-containing protein n=1 Tax=Sporormia fimetaria CBS 119925 TaxID=1340428 RepID=A0A6A6VGK5_9PLEO|nr:hypothetical protein M011DRAFT_398076 [Sporormia fimetaria CBS 119925]